MVRANKQLLQAAYDAIGAGNGNTIVVDGASRPGIVIGTRADVSAIRHAAANVVKDMPRLSQAIREGVAARVLSHRHIANEEVKPAKTAKVSVGTRVVSKAGEKIRESH